MWIDSLKMLWSFQSSLFSDSKDRMEHFLPILKYVHKRQLLSKNGIGSQQMAETIMYWDLGGRGDEEKKKKPHEMSNWNNSKKRRWEFRFFFGSRFFVVWGFSRNFVF